MSASLSKHFNPALVMNSSTRLRDVPWGISFKMALLASSAVLYDFSEKGMDCDSPFDKLTSRHAELSIPLIAPRIEISVRLRLPDSATTITARLRQKSGRPCPEPKLQKELEE